MVTQPSILNGPSVYETGAGGIYNGNGIYNDLKKNYVEFGGITYEYVKIGSLFWITENLKNYTSGALYYNNSEYYKDLGYLYKTSQIISGTNTQSPFIENLVHDGWRVPTRADFETLLNYPLEEIKDKNNSWPTNGNNKTGFNGYMSGYRGLGGSWSLDASAYISQTVIYNGIGYYMILLDASIEIRYNEGSISNEGQRMRSVRLCKDV
jgi:uncharacterized protein (TIGR02145 family)